MIYKKKFFLLFFVSLVSVLLSSCFREYREHYFAWEQNADAPSSVNSSWTFITHFAVLPDKKELDALVGSIQKAKKRIWIEIYTWTEKETLDAVLDAVKRWVDVRVILEANVYQTPRINDHTFHTLRDAGAKVVFSSNKNFTFTHTKFWLIDEIWCLSTGNWSYSTFTKNREFFTCSPDQGILQNLETLFESDFDYHVPYFSPPLDPRLGIAPENMRPWLLKKLSLAKHSLYIYNQTVTDDEMTTFLSERKKEWVDVRLCTSSRSGATDSVLDFPLRELRSPYLHAKLIILDEKDVILWSLNFTSNALDNNRETMVLIEKNQNIVSQVKKLFFRECFPD